jgi:hypothetical protein
MQEDTAQAVVRLPGDVVPLLHLLDGRERGEGIVLRIRLLHVGGVEAGVSMMHDIGHEEERSRESIESVQGLGLLPDLPI